MQIKVLNKYHRALLLQGPLNGFFQDFADWWMSQGRHVWKINFNGGDWFYSRKKYSIDYTDKPEHFEAFLKTFVITHKIDVIFCFGDCRHAHHTAKQIAKALKVAYYVFEEGYVRPYYITLEKDGVNGYSSFPKNPNFYRSLPKVKIEKPLPTNRSICSFICSGFLYNFVARFTLKKYPHYVHHKEGFATFKEIPYWLLAGWRRVFYRYKDWFFEKRINDNTLPPYFVGILQVYNDSQVQHHSDYRSVGYFIKDLMASFAQHAKKEHHLVIKHHPMDLRNCHYGKLICLLTKRYGLEGRIHYVHQVQIPSLLKQSLGVVTINSTVGLSALHHNKPLKVMGRAIYDMPGLTFQGSLDRFWRTQVKIDRQLYRKFVNYVIDKTQLNADFFGKVFFFEESLDPIRKYETQSVNDREMISQSSAQS